MNELIILLIISTLKKYKDYIMQVKINSKCTGCGLCESINSDVFHVDEIAHVNSSKIAGNEYDCEMAAEQCPVGAIEVS